MYKLREFAQPANQCNLVVINSRPGQRVFFLEGPNKQEPPAESSAAAYRGVISGYLAEVRPGYSDRPSLEF